MSKVILTFTDAKKGVDLELDAASFKRIKRPGRAPTQAEQLAVQVFALFKGAEAFAQQHPEPAIDVVVPVRGKACSCGPCDCEQ